jgi:hypothetical protein
MPLCTLGDDFGPTVRCIRGTYIRIDYITPAQFYFSLSLISLTCGTRTSVVSSTFCHLSPPTPSLSLQAEPRQDRRPRLGTRPAPPSSLPSPCRPVPFSHPRLPFSCSLAPAAADPGPVQRAAGRALLRREAASHRDGVARPYAGRTAGLAAAPLPAARLAPPTAPRKGTTARALRGTLAGGPPCLRRPGDLQQPTKPSPFRSSASIPGRGAPPQP